MRLLRSAVVDSIRRSTLREVAQHVGMSPNGLRGFVDGAMPYERSLRRLTQWYFRREGADMTMHAARSAIDVLVRGLAPTEAAKATEAIVHLLLDAYGNGGNALPAWLQELAS